MRSLWVIACPILFLASPASAQFGPAYMYLCEGPRSVDLADVDADGDLDLVIASRQGLGIHVNLDGQGTLDEPYTVGLEETVGCTGDLNGDGAPDIVGSRDIGSGIFIHFNNGQGAFTTTAVLSESLSADELHAADLDDDGDTDLFFALPGGQLALAYNNGYGAFSPITVLATVPQLGLLKALDADADGDTDLICSSHTANQVYICSNIAGELQSPEQVSIAGFGLVKDLDNDGLPDLLMANVASGIVGWQRNGANGQAFNTPVIMDPSFNAPEFLGVMDLDGDGDNDAVVTSAAAEEVAWFENTDGTGTFGPRQTVAFDLPATALAAGDIDNDGDEDLFVASATLNKVIRYTNLASANGTIMGRVFNDLNGDGLFNGADHGLVNLRVEADGLGATYTNASGLYWFNATPAAYTVGKPAEEGWAFTTPGTYDLTVPPQGASQNNDFGLHAVATEPELTPDLGSAPMRCNEDISYWASVSNTGHAIGDVRVTVALDGRSTFLSASPAPDSLQNGVAVWIFHGLQPTHHRDIHIVAHLPGSEHVGDTLHDVMQAVTLLDGVPATVDTRIYSPILLCAVDPNDKQVSPGGEGPLHLTPAGSKLFYQVRFQNTGNAPAHRVVIVDTLSADLDPSSLKMLNSSHVFHAELGPEGVLIVTFDGINLPDSASDPVGSQGFVRFSIAHAEGLEEGTELNNTAGIYFDQNAPVITNTTLNTLTYGSFTSVEDNAASSGDMLVFPNPARGTATVRLGDDFTGRIDVQLFDMRGQLQQQVSRRSNTAVLERGALPAGTYLVRAVDDRGTERVTRLVFE